MEFHVAGVSGLVWVEKPVDALRLRRSIASLAGQTFPLSTIVVSADTRLEPNVEALVRADNLPAIQLDYVFGDGGKASSLGEGFRHARESGEYIARLNAGDVAHNERVERALQRFAVTQSLGAVGTAVYDFVDRDTISSPLDLLRSKVTVQSYPSQMKPHAQGSAPQVCGSSLTYASSALGRVGGIDPSADDPDEDLCLRLVSSGFPVVSLAQPLVWRANAPRGFSKLFRR